MKEIPHAEAVPATLKQPLIDFLLALADDEFILGYWDSEWTGIAPVLEEDVACSSIAQDEIGHARLFYQEVVALTGININALAYGRQIHEYRQAQLVEHQRGDWAFTIARRYLYETFDQLRIKSLAHSTYLPLSQAIAKIQRDETYHQMHVQTWLERLATGTPEARQRIEQALDSLWPDALGLFEPYPSENILLYSGIITVPQAQLQQAWFTAIAPTFERFQLPFPVARPAALTATTETATATPKGAINTLYQPTIKARSGGRRGQHSEDFNLLWEQMTMVYRLDSQASW